MWQSPSIHAQSSSFTSETNREGEEGNSAAVSEDPVDPEILPNSPGLLFCKIPVNTTSLVSQLLPNDSVIQMGPDIQSTRLRNPHRRTYGSNGSQRFCPYTVTSCDALTDTSLGHCDGPDLASDNAQIAQNNNEEESTFQLTTKRSDGIQHLEDIYENNSSPEIDLPTDLDISQNNLQMTDHSLLIPSESDQDNTSIESFSHSLMQLGPTYMESNFPTSQIDSGYEDSSTVNELLLEPETELSLVPLTGADDTPNELYEFNNKCVFDFPTQIINITKPLLQFDDPFISPHRRVFDLPVPTANAQKLANNLIKLSRYLKCPDLTKLCCLDCRYIPVLPVTGQCGHTRCMSCILVNDACPCGVSAPKQLSVNTVIREISEKMMQVIKKSRIMDPGSFGRTSHDKTCPLTGAKKNLFKRQHLRSSDLIFSTGSSSNYVSKPRMPMTIQARHHKARHLVKTGKYFEAASHLVRVAASLEPFSRLGRSLLAKTISVSYNGGTKSNISRKLCQSIREQAAHSWLRPSDLECVLCTNTYSNPVSTPCGHTYCRACMERSLYYKKQCALCLSSLEDFNLQETHDNIFISSILLAIDVSPISVDTVVIPIVTCYMAFPGMPCPLFIIDQRYLIMVRRVLESGSRRFGMLAYERGHTFGDYGTVLEICDCVVLEDSRCIVSTVGVSRFKVVERFDTEGCDVARVQSLTDITPTRDEAQDLHILAVQIYCKAIEWLKHMDDNVREEIETAFGTLPYDDRPEELGTTLDGPNWLWWLIAILPLKSEIQILILSTRSLLKRMLAITRTLDLMDSHFTSNAASMGLVSQEQWMSRNS